MEPWQAGLQIVLFPGRDNINFRTKGQLQLTVLQGKIQ
jgi:hypothetical protein